MSTTHILNERTSSNTLHLVVAHLLMDTDRFLYCIVTGNENGDFFHQYEAEERLRPDKQATTRIEPDLQAQKTRICVWWDYEELIHYEILRNNYMSNANVYAQ